MKFLICRFGKSKLANPSSWHFLGALQICLTCATCLDQGHLAFGRPGCLITMHNIDELSGWLSWPVNLTHCCNNHICTLAGPESRQIGICGISDIVKTTEIPTFNQCNGSSLKSSMITFSTSYIPHLYFRLPCTWQNITYQRRHLILCWGQIT